MTEPGQAAAGQGGRGRPSSFDAHEGHLSTTRHVGQLALLMAAATLLLGWLAAHTDVLFADGLRYVAQAQAFDRGAGKDGLKAAVDHPVYPLAVAVAHRLIGGDTPDDWENAAHAASIAAGVLLVIPLYLVSLELFGEVVALPATLLVYAVPLTGHVFADTLSESTFLLFWTWGVWASLRFLRGGAPGWVAGVVVFSALAYLTRPEGLLLPAALAAAVAASPVWVARGLGRRGLLALGGLVVGSACLVGPFVALKGGLGTKPSVARLLGTAPKSAAHAVERTRPLEPGQSELTTYVVAGRSVVKAVTDAVTLPLLALAAAGLALVRPRGFAARQWRFLGVIGLASVLALVRLHATGGYCSPRHAMIVALVLIPAAAFGLDRLLSLLYRATSRHPFHRCAAWAVAVAALVALQGPALVAPLNPGLDGYRQAGRWLAERRGDGGRVVDVTGWSQFYGGREGYTFENLVAAPADPSARWVVVREAHLAGPWEYCRRLRELVGGREPVETFRGSARRRPTKVYVFDRQRAVAGPTAAAAVRR